MIQSGESSCHSLITVGLIFFIHKDILQMNQKNEVCTEKWVTWKFTVKEIQMVDGNEKCWILFKNFKWQEFFHPSDWQKLPDAGNGRETGTYIHLIEM